VKRSIKGIVTLILIICIVFGIMPFAMASAGNFRTTSVVNLRSSPSTDASVVSTISAGTSVEVTAHDPAGWSRVNFGGNTGYIRSDLLQFPVGNTPPTFRTTSGVNMRESASTDSRILQLVDGGASVEVLEHNPAGWSRVRISGTTGFIRSDFLARGELGVSLGTGATPAQSATPASTSTHFTTGTVNLRSAASTSSNAIRQLSRNTSVEVLGTQGDWTRVRHNGTEGFIRSDLLSSTQVASGATNTSTMYISGNSVNLRSAASTNSNAITELTRNTRVEVLGRQGDWTRVRHNGTEGFIRSDLLSSTQVASATAASTMFVSGSTVRMRSAASTESNIIRNLPRNTSVEVVGTQGDWSRVRHNGTEGFIRSDFLSATQTASGTVGPMRTVTGVNFRRGPSTDHGTIGSALVAGTRVTVLEHLSSGWSRVQHNGNTGYIRSDFLGPITSFSQLTWAEARRTIPVGRDLHVVDVRTGISFTIRAFSLGNHADVEPVTQADTDAIRRAWGGTWSWATRPVWVTIGDRTFPASMNGMPHAGSTISGNGMNGHLCLHFEGSRTHNGSTGHERNHQAAVQEAWNARPR